MGQLHGGTVFNFWQDPAHVRGIWRRTDIASYETPAPKWETLLDVDRLAADEGKSWVFKGANCSPDLSRCLIALSPGGGDPVVLREFDPAAKRFVDEGFALGEAKAEATYVDANTILFSTDFGPGTLTQSGYPRIVKLWRRGEPLANAKIVFEGKAQDVVASPSVFHSSSGSTALVSREVTFFEAEYFAVTAEGGTLPLPLPLYADLKAELDGNLIATLRKDWTPEGQAMIHQGALIAFPLKEFLTTRKLPRVSVLYMPGPRAAIDHVTAGRDAVYATIFENVTGSVHAFRLNPATGAWGDTRLELPSGGSTHLASANDFGPEAYFTFQGFLTPTTLFATKGLGAPSAIKSSPARFNAEPYATVQYEAISRDGTKVPYFVVRAKSATGPGRWCSTWRLRNFADAVSGEHGAGWLPKGGAYAVANIRGGGSSDRPGDGIKTNRQKAFDDFIAVAERDQRGLTSTQLGMGGSNGGLLVGLAVERPDLFAAVVCQVPLLDMLRFKALSASWVGEYGSPDIPEERAAILKYSPYRTKPGEISVDVLCLAPRTIA
jgi:prolyl oligopeptidase